MRILFTVRSTVRLAAFCLLAGFALGFHFGHSAAAPVGPAPSRAEVLDLRHPQPAEPCTTEEVSKWSRTPTSSWSCSGGS